MSEIFEVPSVDFDCPVGITCETAVDNRPPPITQQAKNAASSLIKVGNQYVKKGKIKVNEEVKAERLAICAKCPFNREGQCTACGCTVEKKTRFAAMECPDNPPRWKSTI
jgi:hypothetical protein